MLFVLRQTVNKHYNVRAAPDSRGATKETSVEIKEVIEEIRTKPAVPLWPHAGMALGVCRAAIYAAAARNELEVIRIDRSIRVVSASLCKRLGIERAA